MVVDTRTVEPPKEVKEMNFKVDESFLSGDSTPQVVTSGGQEVKQTTPEIKQGTENLSLPVNKEATPAPISPPVKEEKVAPKETPVESIIKPPKEEKKVETPAVTTPATPAKVEDKPVTPTDLSKLITPAKGPDDKFDYSTYEPHIQTNLRNMSNQSRDWVAGVLKENGDLKKSRDGTFYQHERGYTLMPEFQQLQTKDATNRVETQAWNQALVNIREGKPFRDITGFDQKGNPTFGPEREATTNDQIRVESNLNTCLNALKQNEQEAGRIVGGHQARMNADVMQIDGERKNRFSWAQDPKYLEYTVGIEGRGDVKIKDIISEFTGVFPSYMQNHPLAKVAADLMVALQIRNAELKSALSKAAVSSIKAEEVKRAEPSSNHQPAAGSDGGYDMGNGRKVPKTFNLDLIPS